MIYPIIMYGDPVLRKKAQDIKKDQDILVLVEDMYATMYAAHGIGLAAPQIGKAIRLFVVDGSAIDDDADMIGFKKAFVNPQMLDETGDLWDFEEGCLSIPTIREDVSRKEKIRIRYYDENWGLHEDVFDGMRARVIQHEYDHIEGKLFIDYLTPLKKRMLKGKLSDISKGDVETEYRIMPASKK